MDCGDISLSGHLYRSPWPQPCYHGDRQVNNASADPGRGGGPLALHHG